MHEKRVCISNFLPRVVASSFWYSFPRFRFISSHHIQPFRTEIIPAAISANAIENSRGTRFIPFDPTLSLESWETNVAGSFFLLQDSILLSSFKQRCFVFVGCCVLKWLLSFFSFFLFLYFIAEWNGYQSRTVRRRKFNTPTQDTLLLRSQCFRICDA